MIKEGAKLLSIPAVVAIALSLCACFSASNDFFELASHLRVVYFFWLLLLTIEFLVFRYYKWFAVCLVFVCLNAAYLAPLYMKPPAGTMSKPLSILQFNLWGGKNYDYETIFKVIESNNPDIIGFSEVTQTWENTLLTKLKSKYPYSVTHDPKREPHYGGVCLFSRYPLQYGKVDIFYKSQRARISADVQLPGKTIFFVLAHPKVPKPGTTFRNDEFIVIAEQIKSQKLPAILIGDLNCTPFSAYFDQLLKQASLQDSERGFGYQPTWSLHWPTPLFPIDHLLHSQDFTTAKRETLSAAGSDHYPLLVELAYE